MSLTFVDLAIIVVWLLIALGVGFLAGVRASPSKYWVSERRAPRWPLILSVVITQVGAGVTIGVASSTYARGIGFGLISGFSTVAGFLLVARLAPGFRRFSERYDAISLGEIFRVRYAPHVQVACGAIILICYLGILGAQFVATSQLITVTTGIGIKYSVALAIVGVLVYTGYAGMPGDVASDVLHFAGKTFGLFVLLLPATLLYMPTNWTSQIPPQLWNPALFAGYSFVIAGFLFGALVPLLTPELWMKVYSSRSETDAKSIMVWSAIIVIPFYLLAMTLGLMGSVAWKGLADPDHIVFEQIATTLPSGLRGIALAAILSTTISTANSLILVIGSAVSRDLLQSDVLHRSTNFSRTITFIAGLVGATFALVSPDMVKLLLSSFYLLLVLLPALIGLLVGWGTAIAATSSVVLGAVVTVAALTSMKDAAFLPGFITSIIVFVLVSFVTKAPNAARVSEIKALFRR